MRDQTRFIGGSEVDDFERDFAQFQGVAACVGVANGSDAIELAVRALDLRPGDEVIVPSFTFIATAAMVQLAGGVPVFCDVEPDTLNLDPVSVTEKIGERTVGVIGVHLYGRPFDVPGILELCEGRGLWLIEDAAQAHGASLDGVRVGGSGVLGTWSFYPSKNLSCFGDGGAVTSNDEELAERVRRLSNHGRVGHYRHGELGRNSRLDSMQAAVLNCRLPRLEADNARRREIACRYHGRLQDLDGLRLLEDPPGAVSVYHQMTVRAARRDELQRFLAERGIGSAIHYPLAVHQQPAFADVAAGVHLPVSEAAARDVLCLPMFPELTDDEVDRVCDAVEAFHR